jgi:hypothetical protein
MRTRAALLLPLLAACASPPAPAPLPSAPPLALTAPPEPPPTAAPEPPPPPPPRIDVAPTLFPGGTPPRCAAIADEPALVRCLFAARYDGDAAAGAEAVALFEASGDVAGVLPEQDMEGGFRGRLHLVPEPPLGKHRKHLGWITLARKDFDGFFAKLGALAKAKIAYRHAPLAYRFFRSVGRTTPSAFAEGWTVSYNVSGSLHRDADAVRETLFHEVFHLNDAAHGDWSVRTLTPVFDAVVKRCGTRVACLRPYAPGETMVRGGTYYAFQPDNGESVHEYAAELATRYFLEHRAVFAGVKTARSAFKCGPEENRRAWEALVAEFFGGVDAVPPCAGNVGRRE